MLHQNECISAKPALMLFFAAWLMMMPMMKLPQIWRRRQLRNEPNAIGRNIIQNSGEPIAGDTAAVNKDSNHISQQRK